MEIIKGAATTAVIKQEVSALVNRLGGIKPILAIIRVGERPDDISYERSALKRMAAFGLGAVCYTFGADISQDEFMKAFMKINDDPKVDGILLLRPLPAQLDERAVEKAIDPGKDVDGISPLNVARVFAGEAGGFAPCTPEAVMEILAANHIPVKGKRVTVIGRSMVVGRPLAMLLLKEHATITICHTRTVNLAKTCRQAEILIAAAGKARMVTGDFVGDGAVVIDVGINVDGEGRLCGDVDLEAVKERAAFATPVPGGVGGVTTAVLAKHLVCAAIRRRGLCEV